MILGENRQNLLVDYFVYFYNTVLLLIQNESVKKIQCKKLNTHVVNISQTHGIVLCNNHFGVFIVGKVMRKHQAI